ncbi:MAG: CDP-diacylglycerol--glycerol-3-phosphate 3-phosphatidyltransferase, partial [Dokdonella sp.]
MTLTVPTIITLFRIGLLPVIIIVFYLPEYYPATARWSNVAAAGIFIIAAVTDWLDGWIARRWNMGSAFGAFLDPVADKLMVAVALFLIVQQNPTPLLAVTSAVIVGREISISALREWMAEIGSSKHVRVAFVGKL